MISHMGTPSGPHFLAMATQREASKKSWGSMKESGSVLGSEKARLVFRQILRGQLSF